MTIFGGPMRVLIYAAVIAVFFFTNYSSSVKTVYVNNESEKNSGNRSENSISDDKNYYKNLAHFLRKEPGLSITRAGENVTVRGVNSFNLSITPLYLVEGNAVENSYMEVNNMVTPEEIDYVRVLKRGDAAIYGLRGGNGVIKIFTKKD